MISRYSGSKILRKLDGLKPSVMPPYTPLVPNEYARMRSSGTKKKSPSHTVTGESSPTSLRVQPRPSLPMLGTLYRGEEGRVLAGRCPNVLDDLEPFEDARLQLVTRKVLEGAVDYR